eukprot:CAMPEP_0171647266 /NCGR_PEP_ID=MMETSP0990-20121206/35348_1 /TAXON_ID=483369 /ORGANISM="non described non described, Strain CCMP2098" /LENGTH=250 /DNA_ID=CAMNT_0012224445 /DNA_START=36 /DNA_END=789 /DNA_ORIENTATION=-
MAAHLNLEFWVANFPYGLRVLYSCGANLVCVRVFCELVNLNVCPQFLARVLEDVCTELGLASTRLVVHVSGDAAEEVQGPVQAHGDQSEERRHVLRHTHHEVAGEPLLCGGDLCLRWGRGVLHRGVQVEKVFVWRRASWRPRDAPLPPHPPQRGIGRHRSGGSGGELGGFGALRTRRAVQGLEVGQARPLSFGEAVAVDDELIRSTSRTSTLLGSWMSRRYASAMSSRTSANMLRAKQMRARGFVYTFPQ